MIFDVYLPIPDMHVEGLILIILGLAVGFISGFFGVGGGIIAVPMLNVIFNISFPIAIGSSLALIIGTSVSASYRHHIQGNISYKLGFTFIAGSVIGVELGARIIEIFKNMGEFRLAGSIFNTADFVISFIYMFLLCFVGELMFRESRVSKANSRDIRESAVMKSIFLEKLHTFTLKPNVRLGKDGDRTISFWIIFVLSLVVGFVTGLLGVGGGFILVPAMVYLMKIKTRVAIGTSLFCIIFSSLFGTLTHTVKGNVDIVLVVFLLIGSTVGAQFGAIAMRKCSGPHIRFYFSILVFLAAIMAAGKMVMKILLGI